MDLASHKLPLTGAANTRELGGYPLTQGGETQKGHFLRSDSLHSLTPEDLEMLYDHGVRLAVDLRSPSECEAQPSRLKGYKDVAYINVPLTDNVQSSGFQGEMPASMGEMYVDLLDNSGALIAQALQALADCPACALFNCTAGKDRTGITAMLLLMAAGVDQDTVIQDYACSYENLKEIVAVQRRMVKERFGMDIPEYLFLSEPEQMQQAIDHLLKTYGSAEDYMSSIGLSDETIAKLKKKLA